MSIFIIQMDIVCEMVQRFRTRCNTRDFLYLSCHLRVDGLGNMACASSSSPNAPSTVFVCFNWKCLHRNNECMVCCEPVVCKLGTELLEAVQYSRSSWSLILPPQNSLLSSDRNLSQACISWFMSCQIRVNSFSRYSVGESYCCWFQSMWM
jgi:hypothetical protein